MRDYTRGYDEQLIGFREERTRLEEAGYRAHVKVHVSGLIARGENAEHISSLLGVHQTTVIGWYRDLFLNQQDLVFGAEDFTYRREMNVVKPDARTKGCIVKGIIDGRITEDEALELVSIGTTTKTVIRNWVLKYSRDCDIMMTHPAGSEFIPGFVYSLNREDAEIDQAQIFTNDKAEAEASSRRREAAIARR